MDYVTQNIAILILANVLKLKGIALIRMANIVAEEFPNERAEQKAKAATTLLSSSSAAIFAASVLNVVWFVHLAWVVYTLYLA